MTDRNIYVFGEETSKTALIQMVDDHDLDVIENETEIIRNLIGDDFCLTAIKVRNWNADLSPWEAPAVFGKEDFGHGAAQTLDHILKVCSDKNKNYFLGGYSLAGLFALWAAYQTDIFSGIAAASPSVWFPEFTDYMKDHQCLCKNVYLSLGDKEEKTRNPVMATVGKKIKESSDILISQGVNCTLEWNQGNHFKDPDLRTAKAFAWTVRQFKN